MSKEDIVNALLKANRHVLTIIPRKIYHITCETECGYRLNSVCSAESESKAISLAGWDDDFYKIVSVKIIGDSLENKSQEYATESL